MAESVKRLPTSSSTTPVSVSRSIKKSKSDIVKNVINSYLERRNYIEPNSEEKGNDSYTLSSEQLAVTLFADKASSRFNSILYSSVNNDPKQVMQHYLKWLKWLCSIKSWKVQSELWTLARPLLCHLHLETLRGNYQDQKQCFLLLRHELYEKLHMAHLNESNEENRKEIQLYDISENVLEALQNISTLQDVESFPVVMTFRSCKFRIKLSAISVKLLINYLVKHSHVIILQVLQTWFDIETVDGLTKHEYYEDEELTHSLSSTESIPDEVSNSEPVNVEPVIKAEENSTYDEMLLQHLEECISNLEERPAPILLYNIFNSQRKSAAACSSVNKSLQYVAAGFENSEIRVWQSNCLPLLTTKRHQQIALACADGDEEENDEEGTENSVEYETILRGHCGPVQDIAFLESSSYLMSVSHDTTMRVWDIENNSCKALYSGHNYPIWCMDVSALGMYIATGSEDRTVRIWSPEITNPLRVCVGHTLDVHCTRFHPNGLYVASGSSDRTIRLWNVTNGDLVRLLPVQGSVYCLDFSPNGHFLASAGEDTSIHIWDLAVGNRITELKGHTEPIVALKWTPNGKLYSASANGTLIMWDDPSRTGDEMLNSPIDRSTTFETNYSHFISLQCLNDQIICVGAKPYCAQSVN